MGFIGSIASAQVVIPEYRLYPATITLSVKYESDPVVKLTKDGSSQTQSLVIEKLSNAEILQGLLVDPSISTALGGTIKGASIVAITEDGVFKAFAISKKGIALIDISEYVSLIVRKDGSDYLGGTEYVYSYKTDQKLNVVNSSGSYLTTSKLKIVGTDFDLSVNGATQVGYLFTDDLSDEVAGESVITSVAGQSMFGIAEDAAVDGRGFCYVTGVYAISKGLIIEQPAFLAEVIVP